MSTLRPDLSMPRYEREKYAMSTNGTQITVQPTEKSARNPQNVGGH
ncbi:MAG: hypothetical protein ACRECH_14020 [Nitrososphaerales archaeon]